MVPVSTVPGHEGNICFSWSQWEDRFRREGDRNNLVWKRDCYLGAAVDFMNNSRKTRPHPLLLWEREWKRKPRDAKGRHQGQVIPLDGLLGEWGSNPKVRSSLHEADLFNRWAEIVGDKVGQQAIPARLDRGKLTLQVEDSGWRNQLVYMRRELIGRINGALGDSVVKEIVFTA
ncbi:hypothetical protein BMS3Bbin04_01212 [bacterium BMS3Bbin04]|nr:hypothetical protein BMS3Bbin04_01212 [bacterium BMS3Bbin04]